MKQIMIATPTYDGKLDVRFVDSLIQSMRLAYQEEISLIPIQVPYDALVARARNYLMNIAYKEKMDMIIFIDADMIWNPNDLIKLIKSDKKIIGGVVVKKSYNNIDFNIVTVDGKVYINKDKISEVEGVGTGFLKIDKEVITKLYNSEVFYKSNNEEICNIFETSISTETQEFISEDITFCRKAKKLGYKIYIDPYISCKHVGQNIFYIDFIKWLQVNDRVEFKF